MMRSIREGLKIASAAALLVVMSANVNSARGQYYSWGSDVPSLKWRSIRNNSESEVRMIYPDTIDAIARRTLYYFDTISDEIHFGYKHRAMDISVVMHPENFASNALVMWMPKRIDFLTTPSIESYSMPWTKQLAAHEYRHVVQYNNLNKSWIRVANYILGEQGASLGLLFLPMPIIEGDAVKMETSMSTFGRGLQPNFTMGYRAIGRDMLRRRNVDRWYCGSYLEYTPNHYELGYQIVDYAYTHYGENIWDKVIEFGVRHPYYVITTSTALKKYYDTDSSKLLRASFNDLFDYWDSLPERENSPQIITPIERDNYTTFSHPIAQKDGSVVAIKSDYIHPTRLVEVNPETGSEERIAYLGSVSTRPDIGGGRAWWSEYRYSKLFLQKINSQLCYLDLDRGKTRTVRGLTNTLYPTAIGNSQRRMAYVEYNPNGIYSIVETTAKEGKVRNYKDFEEVSRVALPPQVEIHGLAWDDSTDELYFIATDNSGMWLGARDRSAEKGYRELRKGAYITLSDLRAGGGRLYFGSIESGYDELHCYDINSGIEYRLSQSEFGSFDPSAPVGGYTYATTYDKYGYHLSRQAVDEIAEVVTPTNTPQNIVNPKRTKWDLTNLDEVTVSESDLAESREEVPSKRFSKVLNLFKVHSWLPVAFNPFNLSAEQMTNITYGATLVSQNLLSSTEAYASYGHSPRGGSVVDGYMCYRGWGVDLAAGAKYGGEQNVYNPFKNTTSTSDKYHSFFAQATLPLLYQRGYHTRMLSLYTGWNYNNGKVLNLNNITSDDFVVDNETGDILIDSNSVGYHTGLHKLVAGVSFSDSVRAATRDPQTPWGYSLSATYSMSPSDRNFSDLLSIYGKVVTRGFAPYNAISLEMCYQNSFGGYKFNKVNLFSFSSIALLPRGFVSSDIVNCNYASASVNYQFPIWYPEGGIGSILYFRRMRLNFGADIARFSQFSRGIKTIGSYGADLILDVNPLRMPEASTTSIKLSVYKPSIGPLSFTTGMVLPF